MIVEQRRYTIAPGRTNEFLSAYEAEGLAIQTKVLGNLIAYFTTATGTLNQIVHIWGYSSHDEWRRRRDELGKDPDWQSFAPRLGALIVSQQIELLVPTSFSPIR